jgi:hypothetical protein
MNKYLKYMANSVKRGVLGEDVHNIYRISSREENNSNGFRIYFYFKTSPTEEDLETVSIIETSIYGDYPDLYDMKTSYVEWDKRETNLKNETILWENKE